MLINSCSIITMSCLQQIKSKLAFVGVPLQTNLQHMLQGYERRLGALEQLAVKPEEMSKVSIHEKPSSKLKSKGPKRPKSKPGSVGFHKTIWNEGSSMSLFTLSSLFAYGRFSLYGRLLLIITFRSSSPFIFVFSSSL